MSAQEILRSVAALAGVLGVILVCAWILRRTRFAGAPIKMGRARDLTVLETANVDARRKAAVVRWRSRDYFVVFAGENGVVVADSREAVQDAEIPEPDRPSGTEDD